MSLRSMINMSLRGSLGRMLKGGGLALLSYGVLTVAITNALVLLIQNLQATPADMLNFLRLCGVGDALSIVGAAILTRNAFNAKMIGVTAGAT